MHSVVIDVTPKQAEAWLEKNTFNRGVSQAVVNKYASDMSSGNWTLNHQGIAFGADGVLVDGQHRLMAIIKSGVTIKMLVTFGSERTGVDELRVRSQYDVVRFGGLSSWMTKKDMETGKVAAQIFVIQNRREAMSTTQVVEFCDKNKDAIEWAREQFTSNMKGVSQAAVRGVFMVAYYHFDKSALSRMIRNLYTGVVSSELEAPAIRARDMIISGEFSGGGGDRLASAKKLTRAIQAYCAGESLSRLMPQRDFSFTIPEEKK